MLRLVCLALLVAASSALHFKDCGNGEVKSLEVSGCSSDPCVLHKGQETTITVHFEPSEDSEKAELHLIAKVGDLELEVPGVDTDGCKYMSCPVSKGKDTEFVYKVTIPSVAPTVEADVTAKLVGDGGKVLVCGTLHGSLKD